MLVSMPVHVRFLPLAVRKCDMERHTFEKEARLAGFTEDIHGNFVFREFQIKPSHNYYHVLTGYVPLALAQRLYATPIGKRQIRVSGHCGCPPPEAPWVDWYTDDWIKVVPMTELPAFERLMPEKIKDYHFADMPSMFNGFITLYHIDSLEGLIEFVRIANEYYNEIQSR